MHASRGMRVQRTLELFAAGSSGRLPMARHHIVRAANPAVAEMLAVRVGQWCSVRPPTPGRGSRGLHFWQVSVRSSADSFSSMPGCHHTDDVCWDVGGYTSRINLRVGQGQGVVPLCRSGDILQLSDTPGMPGDVYKVCQTNGGRHAGSGCEASGSCSHLAWMVGSNLQPEQAAVQEEVVQGIHRAY